MSTEAVAIPSGGNPGTVNERTFIAVKPDGVQRGQLGNIIGRFENKGFHLVAMKLVWPTKEKAAGHYDDLKAKKFFAGLCDYFSSGPVLAMVWEGSNVVKTGRVLLGATNPADSLPGTIRGDLCIDIGRNVCHGSDATDAAQKEINFWFSESEICNWNAADDAWVYEKGVVAAVGGGLGDKAVDECPQPSKLPAGGEAGTNKERTFIAIKPDGVQRGKIGNIISRFEARGFKLVALRFKQASKEMAEKHYADLSKKPFFPGLVSYFCAGPIVTMGWEGKGSIKTGRVLLGATNPADSLPGTIRGDLCIDVGRNICHGSDGPDSAKHEMEFWFPAGQICDYEATNAKWIYE